MAIGAGLAPGSLYYAVASMSDLRDRFVATAVPFMGAVYGTALRMSGRPDVAEDVTQETYLRAFRTFDRFQRGTDCKTSSTRTA